MSLKSRLSNYILKVTSSNFKRKDKIRKSNNPATLVVAGVTVIASELYLVLISLPTYLMLNEKDLKKQGYDEEGVKVYKLRKRISLSTLSLGALFLVVRFGILALTSVWLGQYLGVSANSVNYDLADKGDYTISKSIQITDGMAVLKKDDKREEKGQLCSGKVEVKDSLEVNSLQGWTGFVEVADAGEGTVGYQLSLDDRDSWVYWDGSAWVEASEDVEDGEMNTAEEISENISKIDPSNNAVNVKAVLYGSCAGDVKLLEMGVAFDIEKVLLARRNLNDKVAQEDGDTVINRNQIDGSRRC